MVATWLPSGEFIGGLYDAQPIYSRYINYDIDIPLSHWQKGAEVVPPGAQLRHAQLQEYLNLYNGEIEKYFEQPLEVKVNYWITFTTRLINFLLQFQPEFDFDYSDVVSERFVKQLRHALPNMITDIVRFGSCTVNIVNGPNGAEFTAPIPINWYPAGDEGDAFIIPGDNKDVPHLVYIHEPDGVITMARYQNDAGKLGKRMGSETETFGNRAAWDILRERTLGRVSPMFSIPSEPNMGEWGRSLYFDATSMALELNRILSTNSHNLEEHGDPAWVLQSESAPGYQPQDAGLQDREIYAAQYEARRLGSLRRSPVIKLPAGYAAEYMTPQVHVEQSFQQYNKVMETMFAVTHLPLNLMGVDGTITIPMSGRALRFQFVDTDSYTDRTQTLMKDGIEKAFGVAAIYNGAGATQVGALLDNIEIVWENIFDKMAEPTQGIDAGLEAPQVQAGIVPPPPPVETQEGNE